LIYPSPDTNLTGLGIHLTVDTYGNFKFGPDFQYVREIDYSFHDVEMLKEAFCNAIRRYLPSMETRYLVEDFTGIRPKLSKFGEPFRDFIINEETKKGFPGVINLIGIESPGLTASLSISKHVSSLLGYA